ncbi:hypothetical protein [Paenibacillus brasilensis]|uniref:YjcQ protein n=1 Tax=Paenibacillus brasilensis TaxID=128574 RepID=A0ABU0KTM7_9BACL|nr:hypothetical protein [Paenibacillus brasilensis]MDQ0492778.1 hypothetical protein [Paenibacillus brasilensis]
MNKFEIELLKNAFHNLQNNGVVGTIYQMKNGDDWLYNSEALKYLAEEGYISVSEDFDPDESNVFVISQPVKYSLTVKGVEYIKQYLKM